MRKPYVSPLGLLTALVILLAFGTRGGLRAAEGPDREDAGATLKGTVVDPDGKPVAGARVSAHSRGNAYDAEYDDPIAQALTDDRGRFELQGVEDTEAAYVLLICADGYADALVLHELGGAVGGEVPAVTLGKAFELRGRVGDTSGKPIEGARVCFLTEEYFSSRPVMTKPDGTFTIAFAPETVFGLEVSKDGYYEDETELGPVGGGKPIEISLVRRPTVSGIVTDAATGKPIADASVYCMRRKEPVKTDAEGRYAFTGLDEGERRFGAIAPGLASPKLVTVLVRNDEATVIHFVLEPSKPIRGLVVDGRTKKPVPGVFVDVGIEFTKAELAGPTDRSISIPGHGTFMIPEGRSMEEAVRGTAYSPFTATSDVNGAFTIPCSYPEMTALYVHPTEHLETEGKLTGADLSKVLVIELDEGGVVAGRVLGPDGTPAPDVTVLIGIGRLVREKHTDADGRFRFGGLYREDWARRYTLAAVDPNARRGALTSVIFRKERVIENVELTLVEHGTVGGTITDNRGNPVSGLWPRIKLVDGKDTRSEESRFSWDRVTTLYHEALGSARATNAAGVYASGPLSPGTYEVSVSIDREARKTADGTKLKMVAVNPEKSTITIEAGKTADRADFVVEFERTERKTATVAGRVVDADSEPIAGAKVACYSSAIEELLKTTTDTDGAFTLADVDAGECVVHASAKRFMSDRVRVEAPADGVLIKLFPSGAIAGRVVDAKTGEAVESYRLGLEGPPEEGGGDQCPMLEEDDYHPEGRYELDGLEAGTYHLTVYARGYAEALAKNIRIEEDGVAREVLIKLVEGTKVTLRVTSALDGKPVAGARIGEHQYYDMAKTRRDGTAVFEHCPATLHRLLVRKVGHADKWITFTPPADKAEMTVDVVLDKGVTVCGRVISAVDERPIVGAFVIMTRDGWPKWDEPGFVDPGDRSTRTNGRGEFTFDLVSSEHHILTFQHWRHVRTMVARRFGDKTNEELVVKMGQGGRVVGTVTGPDGEPVARAWVRLSDERSNDYDDRTNWHGMFSFKRLPSGTYKLNIHGKGGQSLERIVEVREGLETRADAAFTGASLSGTVTLKGQPCAGQDVWIRSKRSSWSWASKFAVSAKTDEQGRYRLEGVPPGDYIWATRIDDGTRLGRAARRTVRLGEGNTELNIELEGLLQASSISGVITSEDGSPLPGAWVWIERSLPDSDVIEAAVAALDPDWARPTVNADGTFTCRDLDPGSYILRANCRRYESTMVPIEKPPGQDVSDIAVKLQARKANSTVALSGTARAKGGGTLWRLRLTALDEQECRPCGQWDEVYVKDGGYLVRIPAGTLKLIAEAEGHAPIVAGLTTKAGTDQRLDLEFTKGSELTVTVVDEAGAPVPEALVLLDADGDPWIAAILSFPVPDPDLPLRQLRGTGPDGTITLENTPDDNYTVHVRRKGYHDASTTVRITGADAAVTVKMPAAED